MLPTMSRISNALIYGCLGALGGYVGSTIVQADFPGWLFFACGVLTALLVYLFGPHTFTREPR